MNKENLIHVKLENVEAIEGKKDLLQSEISLLRIAQRIKSYQILRKKELSIRIKLARKLNGTKINITKIQKTLPQIQVKHIRQGIIKTPSRKIEFDKSLEDELRNIQDKLARLQS